MTKKTLKESPSRCVESRWDVCVCCFLCSRDTIIGRNMVTDERADNVCLSFICFEQHSTSVGILAFSDTYTHNKHATLWVRGYTTYLPRRVYTRIHTYTGIWVRAFNPSTWFVNQFMKSLLLTYGGKTKCAIIINKISWKPVGEIILYKLLPAICVPADMAIALAIHYFCNWFWFFFYDIFLCISKI